MSASSIWYGRVQQHWPVNGPTLLLGRGLWSNQWAPEAQYYLREMDSLLISVDTKKENFSSICNYNFMLYYDLRLQDVCQVSFVIPSCSSMTLLCSGCSYQVGSQSSASAHDGSGPLVSEPTHRVHRGCPDRIETNWRGLRHLRVERDYRVLHRWWVTWSMRKFSRCCMRDKRLEKSRT